MLRRKSLQQQCLANATWSQSPVQLRKRYGEKKAKSESRLDCDSSSNRTLVSPVSDEGMKELLRALRSDAFCGKLNPTNFDHSLKDDEWIRLPSRRGAHGDKLKRVIIPTPRAMYDNLPKTITCDTTVSSSASADSGKKRRRSNYEDEETSSLNEAFERLGHDSSSSLPFQLQCDSNNL